MRRKKRTLKLDDEMDITPMIDVTFLLLIFFMVTSKMEDTSALEIPPARNGLGVSVKDSVVLSIFKTDADPEIYLSNGKKENGPVSLEEVTTYVREGLAEQKRTLIIKADRDIPSGFVEDVARAASEADENAGTEEAMQYFVGVIDKPG
ncbi:MAG: biopolymer transporter ExbD [Planctomycetaceae bacterium]|nr:biopolymer transporter ExbD [Planctomycetaceae bacterium]